MDSKNNIIYNYTIIESFPSILKHRIPLIQIGIYFIFIPILIYYNIMFLINKIYNKDFSSFKKKKIIFGPVEGEISYNIETESFKDKEKSEIENIKRKNIIEKTIIVYYFGNKAIKRLTDILIEKNLENNIEHLPSKKGFVLKEEKLFLLNQLENNETSIYLTKSYTVAALRTLYILEYIVYILKLKFIFNKDK